MKSIDVKRAVVKKIAPDFFLGKLNDRLNWGRVKTNVLRFSVKKYRLSLKQSNRKSAKPGQNEDVLARINPMLLHEGPGLIISKDVVMSAPYWDAPCFTQSSSGFVDLSRLRLKQIKLGVGNMHLKATGVNKKKLGPIDMAFFTREFGNKTPAATNTFSIIGRKIHEVAVSVGISIPQNGIAVAINAPAGSKEMLTIKSGMLIDYDFPPIDRVDDRTTAFQGREHLLIDSVYAKGEIADEDGDETQGSPEEGLEKMAYLAVGLTPDFNVIIACLSHDMRQTSSILPKRVVATLMKDLGCVSAMSSSCRSIDIKVAKTDSANTQEQKSSNWKTHGKKSAFPEICVIKA